MLEAIKKAILEKYWPDEKKWFFLSGYNPTWTLLFSKWILHTDTWIKKLIETLFYKYVEQDKRVKSNVWFFVCDIISQIIEVTNPNDIFKASMSEYWIALVSTDSNKSWIVLPNTEWVADAKQAVFLIKQKEKLDGRVNIYAFRTDRIQIDL